MINPYKLTDGKKYAVIQGYVIDVKDRGDANMVLFKKDTHDPSSKLVAVAAWALSEGQTGADLREMTMVREKMKDGKMYENYDLIYIVKPPEQKKSA